MRWIIDRAHLRLIIYATLLILFRQLRGFGMNVGGWGSPPLTPAHTTPRQNTWNFGPHAQRKWNELQNTSRDIRLLSNYLLPEGGDPAGSLIGQLLGEHAAKRDAEHAETVVAEAIEQVLNHPGESSHAQRPPQVGRLAGARRINWKDPGWTGLVVITGSPAPAPPGPNARLGLAATGALSWVKQCNRG